MIFILKSGISTLGAILGAVLYVLGGEIVVMELSRIRSEIEGEIQM